VAEDKPLKPVPLGLTGKWRPVHDGTQLADGDFQTLTNMRYTDAPGIKSISGMTAINTFAVVHPKIKSGYHFRKEQPAESHILVQGFDLGLTESKVYDNKTAVPAAGEFEGASVFSDTSGAVSGKFSQAPDGCVAYCNGQETCVWGGNEYRYGSIIISNAAGTAKYDYSSRLNTTVNDTLHQAVLAETSYIYIGSLRPIKGIKFYVSSANTKVATMVPSYWNGSTWTACAGPSDGTATDGKPLAKTGILLFTSTLTTAKPKVYENMYLYWYLVTFTGVDMDATIYYVTVDAPFQPIVDLWDGIPRGVQYFSIDSTANQTTNVFAKDYNSYNTASYADLSSFATTSALVIGFGSRLTSINFGFVPGKLNSNAATMTLDYWNGTAWTSVGTLDDQTSLGGKSFCQDGWVSWNAPSESIEYKYSFNGGPLWWFYRIKFSANLSANLYLDYILGITAQRTMLAYNLSATWQNRMVLLGQMKGQKNALVIGGFGAVCVFNGNDAVDTTVGDESIPTAVGSLFTRDASGFYDTLIICKKNETWLLNGSGVDNYRLYKVSDMYGCVAPETFRVFPVSYGLAPGILRHVAIWQSATGIVMFDGNTIGQIDEDIRNYFDLNKSECITAGLIDISTSFVDEREQEYHWLFASGSSATILNTELVYSMRKKGWYKVDRVTTNNQLQCGIPVKSTIGASYVYGGTILGGLMRLEYGNTLLGSNITSTFKTKDYSVGWTHESEARWVKLISKATASAVTATLSAFLDTSLTAETKTLSMALLSTTRRTVQSTQSCSWGPAAFCSFQGMTVTSNIAVGFEPIGIALLVKQIREDTRNLVS
jgi:hypothetical protein